jgi:hypothetical protein
MDASIVTVFNLASDTLTTDIAGTVALSTVDSTSYKSTSNNQYVLTDSGLTSDLTLTSASAENTNSLYVNGLIGVTIY